MSSTAYLSKIKAKYGIKDGPRSTKFVTIDDYNQSQREIKREIDEFFRKITPTKANFEIYRKTCKVFLESNQNFRLLELWEDPSPDTYIKCLIIGSKGIIKFSQGYVYKSTPSELWINSLQNPKKIRKINRHCLIFTKYSGSQMKALELNRTILRDRI